MVDGEAVGLYEGPEDGILDGIIEGAAVGAKDGLEVGTQLGAVGIVDGVEVGAIVSKEFKVGKKFTFLPLTLIRFSRPVTPISNGSLIH